MHCASLYWSSVLTSTNCLPQPFRDDGGGEKEEEIQGLVLS